MTILAHLNHWWSPVVMLAPALLTLVWLRAQSRREEQVRERTGGRAARFGAPAVVHERWTIVLRDGRWRLDSAETVGASSAARSEPDAPPVVPSPWNAASGVLGHYSLYSDN
jgi:hypothetical protein